MSSLRLENCRAKKVCFLTSLTQNTAQLLWSYTKHCSTIMVILSFKWFFWLWSVCQHSNEICTATSEIWSRGGWIRLCQIRLCWSRLCRSRLCPWWLRSKQLYPIRQCGYIQYLYKKSVLKSTDQMSETANMVAFNMMQSSLSQNLTEKDTFLASAVNWEPASTWNICATDEDVVRICQLVKDCFQLQAKPWQVNVIRDITILKQDICAIADTSTEKSLVYQAILVVTGNAVLVVSPTITLMHDQCKSIRKTGLTVAALTLVAIAENFNLWRWVDQSKYNIVLVSPEVLLANWSWFWQKMVRAQEGVFTKQLYCIVIDKTHLIWGWQEFQNEYQNLGYLKDIFHMLPTLILSVTVTSSIFKYIQVFLKISGPSRIHKEPFDRPNFTYMMTPIWKPQ